MMTMNDLARRMNARALQAAPQDPTARRIDWLYRSNEGKADVAEMKQISASAPNWSFPYMALRGKGVGDDEALRAQLQAVFLTPSNDGAWMNLAYAFEKTTRYDAAYRIVDRMIDRDPADAGLYLTAVSFMRQAEREGDTFREAIFRYRVMMKQSRQSGLLNVQGFTQVQAGEFWIAIAHFDVGRIDEAIAIGAKAIGEDDGQRLQWQHKQLKEWRTDPATFARAYAREGHFRGDPGRVLEGFGFLASPTARGDAAPASSTRTSRWATRSWHPSRSPTCTRPSGPSGIRWVASLRRARCWRAASRWEPRSSTCRSRSCGERSRRADRCRVGRTPAAARGRAAGSRSGSSS